MIIGKKYKFVTEEEQPVVPEEQHKLPEDLYEYYANKCTLEDLQNIIAKGLIDFVEFTKLVGPIDMEDCPCKDSKVAILLNNPSAKSAYIYSDGLKKVFVLNNGKLIECCPLEGFLSLAKTQYDALKKSTMAPAVIDEPTTEMTKLKNRMYDRTLESYKLLPDAIKVMSTLSESEIANIKSAMPHFNTDRIQYRDVVVNEHNIPIGAVEVTPENLRVFVSPQYRGKGLGSMLLHEAVDASLAYNHEVNVHTDDDCFESFINKIPEVSVTEGLNNSKDYTVTCETPTIVKKIIALFGNQAPIRVRFANEKPNKKSPIFKKSENAFLQLMLETFSEVVSISAMKTLMNKDVTLELFESSKKPDINSILPTNDCTYKEEKTYKFKEALDDYGINPDEFYKKYKRLHSYIIAYTTANKVVPTMLRTNRLQLLQGTMFLGKYYDDFDVATKALLDNYMLLADDYVTANASVCDFVIDRYTAKAASSEVGAKYTAANSNDYFRKELFKKASEIALKLQTIARCNYITFAPYYTTEYSKKNNCESFVTVRIMIRFIGETMHSGVDTVVVFDQDNMIYTILGEILGEDQVVTEARDIVDNARHAVNTVIDKTKKVVGDVSRTAKAVLDPLEVNLRKMVDSWGQDEHNDEREAVITGSTYLKLHSMFKAALAPAVILFSGHLLLGIIAGVVQSIRYAKDKNAAKTMAINELELELKITEEKIDDSRSNGDNEAKYKLMRIKNKLEHEIVRLKYAQHVDN